ncbi:MAG: GNAT family N-acetyltransferase [Alphaproteobacteria bacterium]|nr:GNAT family N-acetyltransferase [Alphaproteobacteria bacterium]MCB9699593.1 GNAT family N-acetyltransferase [Alphaproteobacteria bacterium]
MSNAGRPPFVVRATDISEIEGHYPAPFDAEKLSFGRDLGRAAGSRSLGCWQERLPRGRRTSFTHAHLREEELIYVLAGTPTLRWRPPGGEAEEVPLEPGDLVAFPAGTGIAHTFRNDADMDAILLCIGERRLGDGSLYPDDPAWQAWRDEHRPQYRWPNDDRPSVAAEWPAWRIETDRLVLRPWEQADVPDLLALQRENQEHLAPTMPWARTLPTLDELLGTVRSFLRSFLEADDLVYGIFLPDGTPIGGTGLHPRIGPDGLEIGYWISKRHEGLGLVTEAAGALTRLALEVHRKQVVEIHCDPRNTRSAAIPARLGYTHVGTLPGRTRDALGRPRETMIWSLLSADLLDSPAHHTSVMARDALGRRLI